MRTIKWSAKFKREYRRVKATPRYSKIDALLEPIIGCWETTIHFQPVTWIIR
jgi:hypothetical protein